MKLYHKTINNYNVYFLNDKLFKNITRIQVTVKAGTFRENPKISGISHLLEHILLDSWSSGRSTSVFNDLGIHFNASTAAVLVTYFIFADPKYSELMINFMSSIITDAVITDEVIEDSKKAVSEELLNYINNGSLDTNNILHQNLFKHEEGLKNLLNYKHQYEVLKSITKEDIINFYKKYYTKENIIFLFSSYKNYFHIFKKFLKEKSHEEITYDEEINRDFNDNEPFRMFKLIKPSAKKITYKVGFNNYDYNCSNNISKYLFLFKEFFVGDLNSYLYKELRIKSKLVYEVNLDFEITDKSIATIFGFSCSFENKDLLLKNFFNLLYLLRDNMPSLRRTKEKINLRFQDKCNNADYYTNYYSLELICSPSVISPEENNNLIMKITEKEFLNVFFDLISKNCVIVYDDRV